MMIFPDECLSMIFCVALRYLDLPCWRDSPSGNLKCGFFLLSSKRTLSSQCILSSLSVCLEIIFLCSSNTYGVMVSTPLTISEV